MQVLNVRDIQKITGMSRTTIWRHEKNGEFPKRMKLTDSGRSVGWLESDIREWLQSRKDKAAEVADV